jgi:hypothetical protein
VFVVVDVIHASLTLTSAKEPPVAAQLLPAGDRALLLAELRTELARPRPRAWRWRGATGRRCWTAERAWRHAPTGYRCAIGTGSTGSARSKPNTRP